jgi:hypothetical protein
MYYWKPSDNHQIGISIIIEALVGDDLEVEYSVSDKKEGAGLVVMAFYQLTLILSRYAMGS